MADARVAGLTEVAVTARRSHGFWGDTIRRLVRTPSGVVGLVIVVAMILIGFVGPALLPYTYYEQDLDAVIAYGGPIPPGVVASHPLGTDVLGRDLLSRTVDGAQVSLTVALVAQLVVLGIGIPVGLLAGWRGGKTETGLMRFTDIIGTFPDLLFIIMIQAAIVGTPFFTVVNGLLATFIAIGLISWVGTARLVRGQTLELLAHFGGDVAAEAPLRGALGEEVWNQHPVPRVVLRLHAAGQSREKGGRREGEGSSQPTDH